MLTLDQIKDYLRTKPIDQVVEAWKQVIIDDAEELNRSEAIERVVELSLHGCPPVTPANAIDQFADELIESEPEELGDLAIYFPN